MGRNITYISPCSCGHFFTFHLADYSIGGAFRMYALKVKPPVFRYF